MRFDIAGLGVEVVGLDGLPPLMANLAPFAAKAGGAADVVCTVACGCRLADVGGCPSLEDTFDGKTLRLWLTPGGCAAALRFSGGGVYRLRASGGWRFVETDCRAATEADCMALGDFIMMSFIYSAASYGTVLVHASGVAVGASAVLFIGPSGVGKSTHSRLWLRHVAGARLLNDDQPALRVMPDGGVNVYGTPWSGKTPCYLNGHARLRAVFRMVQADENMAVRLTGAQAFCALLDMTSLIKADVGSFSMISGTVAAIAERVGTYTLYNRPDLGAVAASHGVFRQCGGDA